MIASLVGPFRQVSALGCRLHVSKRAINKMTKLDDAGDTYVLRHLASMVATPVGLVVSLWASFLKQDLPTDRMRNKVAAVGGAADTEVYLPPH